MDEQKRIEVELLAGEVIEIGVMVNAITGYPRNHHTFAVTRLLNYSKVGNLAKLQETFLRLFMSLDIEFPESLMEALKDNRENKAIIATHAFLVGWLSK
jgi:hypothetical protein